MPTIDDISALRGDKLQRYLASLPLPLAESLAGAVERARLAGEAALPHALILDALRPRLRECMPPARRMPHAQRVFCEPFEDLLIDRHALRKIEGRVARSSLGPIWAWIGTRLIPAPLRALSEALHAALLGKDPARLAAARAAFLKAVAGAMRAAIDAAGRAAPDREALARLLGGDEILEDARDILAILEIEEAVGTLKAMIPPRHPSLDEVTTSAVRELFEETVRTHPDNARFLLFVAMARLAHPWEALRIATKLANRQTDILVSRTDVGRAGELLLHDLDVLAADIARFDPRTDEPARLLGALTAFAKLSQGIPQEIEVRREGEWGKHLAKARASVAAKMEGLLAALLREISAGLPLKRQAAFGKRRERRPDLARAPGPAVGERLIAFADLIVGCRSIAQHAAFNVALSETLEGLSATLGDYSPALIQAIREADAETRKIAFAYLDLAAELTRRLKGETEADLLRRQASVAALA